MTRALAIVVIGLASCTVADDFAGFRFDGGAPASTDGGGGSDAGACSASGQRTCIDARVSGHCEGTAAVADRACPDGSSCSDGYCRPPTGSRGCSSAQDCMGGTCAPFVMSGVLVGFCVGAPSLGFYMSCAAPGDALACAADLCAVDAQDARRQCLFLCATDNDCPNGGKCLPLAAPATIEGVSTGALRGCFN